MAPLVLNQSFAGMLLRPLALRPHLDASWASATKLDNRPLDHAAMCVREGVCGSKVFRLCSADGNLRARV